MQRFELLTSLPSVLSYIILQDWLVLRSVVTLDSAYCCHSRRNMFLDLLEADQYFVREQVTIASQGLILNAMQKYGEKFRSVLFADKLSSAEATLVVSHCRNLTHVCFGGMRSYTRELQNLLYQQVVWMDLSDADLDHYTLQLPQLCPLLKSVGLAATNLTDHMLNKITAACPHIVHIDIARNQRLTNTGILHLVTNLKGIQSLNIENNLLLSDASLVHIYKHCSGSLQALYLNCRETFDFVIDASVFSAAGINSLLGRCTQLRTLFLGRDVWRLVTPIALTSINAMVNLTTLVLGGKFATTDNISSIGRHCINLHTLAIDVEPSINSSIAGLLDLVGKCVKLRELYVYFERFHLVYDRHDVDHKLSEIEQLKTIRPWLVIKNIRYWSELSEYDVMNILM